MSKACVRRVACAGDSITFGQGLADPARESYPALLAGRLGSAARVGNFGVNGATVLRRGTLPYGDQPAFRDAAAFAPDGVVLMLGTNDCKPRNTRVRREFAADLGALVDRFRALPCRPHVWLCLPPPVFSIPRLVRGWPLARRVLPAIRAVASDLGAPLIDVHSALQGCRDCFPDGIHPDAAGAALIAETVFRGIAPALPPAGGLRSAP